MGLNGIIEIPGFLLPLLLLTYFGRKISGIALLIISGIPMFVILTLPQGNIFFFNVHRNSLLILIKIFLYIM